MVMLLYALGEWAGYFRLQDPHLGFQPLFSPDPFPRLQVTFADARVRREWAVRRVGVMSTMQLPPSHHLLWGGARGGAAVWGSPCSCKEPFTVFL